MAITAKDGAADLWVERDAVVLAAMIANYLESFFITGGCGSTLGPAFLAALRCHHVSLIEHFLFAFSEQKGLFALHTYGLYVRHRTSPIWCCSSSSYHSPA